MSVFGGDSWAREAELRKRRIDDLMLTSSTSLSSSSYKRLSNGKYACLICPKNPVLDSPLMLSMHRKGSRHIAAESTLKEKQSIQSEELKRRIALPTNFTDVGEFCLSNHLSKFSSKPLIKKTKNSTIEALCRDTPEGNLAMNCCTVKSKQQTSCSLKGQPASEKRVGLSSCVGLEINSSENEDGASCVSGEASEMFAELQKR